MNHVENLHRHPSEIVLVSLSWIQINSSTTRKQE